MDSSNIFSVIVAGNQGPAMRTGMIYTSPTGHALEVRQLAPGKSLLRCDFQVPAILNLIAGERTEPLIVTPTPAGCTDPDSWQAESHDPWIETQSTGKSTNPGTLTIHVASNAAWYEKDKRGPGPPQKGRRHETSLRTRSLTIPGKTVVVNQAGSLSPPPAEAPPKDQVQALPPSPASASACSYQVQPDLNVGRTVQTITLQVTPVPSGCADTPPGKFQVTLLGFR